VREQASDGCLVSCQQVADSHERLVGELHGELNWLSDIEQLLRDDTPVAEEAYRAQSQREALKVSYPLGLI